MATIDFSRIRSSPKSRNDSFESLAVQLFRSSCAAPEHSTFISLRGDGGDGGVEAYFRTPTDDVLGVQAKYFFQLTDKELRQIAGSLTTALSNHPTLTEYWVYIPFDLTGRVAAGARGVSQAERFEIWKKEVEAEAVERRAPLKVALCTAAVIRTQLLGIDPNGGRRRYWFDDSVLTEAQLRNSLDAAIAFAGPRFTAALDVATGANAALDFFGGIGDFGAWREEALAPVISTLRNLAGRGDKSLGILGEAQAQTARELIRRVIALCSGIAEVSDAASVVAGVSSTLSELMPLLVQAREAQEQAFYDKYGREHDTPAFRQSNAEYMCTFPAGEMDATREWEAEAHRLQSELASPELGAATARSLLLVGPAGIGKTHSIVSAALRRMELGGYSLVVFGDDFGRAEPWEVVRSKLGFGGDVERAELFECLQACADNTGLPFVIYIDALNESPRNTRWKKKLPELLAECEPYPGVKVCVSTRDTYRDLVADARFPGYAFQHRGFAGHEFEAVQAFAAHYGLDTEITPLFAPELSNPLFLHLACRALKEEGRQALDVSLPGFTTLMESYLKHCDKLVRERLQYVNPRNLVRAAVMRLAEVLTQNLPQERTWEACTTALQSLVGTEVTAESLLKELEREELIILSGAENGVWLVRFGYQRYGDLLRAMGLVEIVETPSGVDLTVLAAKLSDLTADDEGFLEALAAVLPEKTGVEITASELGLDPELAHRLFINALPWRSRASITDDIDGQVYEALNTPGLWQDVYDVFLRLSLVPGHRLNAENWLGPFLRRTPLVNRDAYLSFAAFKSFDNDGAAWSLINAALRADINRWPADSRRLAAFTLAWLTSAADRRVRDLSAKALARVVANQPGLGRELTREFEGCDDDYILERVALAIYSACLLALGRRAEFLPALDGLLTYTFDTPNVLVRDSVRLLATCLADVGIPEQMETRLEAYPSKAAAPRAWPTLVDAKPLLELEGLPLNMKLWGTSLHPDFWRYQVEWQIRAFDLDGASITDENIACWLMAETLKLGYPGENQRALLTDRAIHGEFGGGRGRKGYADRLGKKYYWILLHRLIGVLADNIAPKQSSYSRWKPGPRHLWSVNLRKVDLTDVRDISPERGYPDEILRGPRYSFPNKATSDIKKWVRLDDFTPHAECIIRISDADDEWVALSLSASDDDRPSGNSSWGGPYLAMHLFYTSIFVDAAVSIPGTMTVGRDPFQGNGASCYRGYFAEYPDGVVFDQLADQGDFDSGPKGMQFSEVTLSRGREWEYDYSYTSAERQEHLDVPCPDLVRHLALRWDRQRGWVDTDDELVAFESHAMGRRGLFVRRPRLNQYLSATGKKLAYRRFVIRGLYGGNGSDGPQIDVFTWLLYQAAGVPVIKRQEARPFNC